MGFWRLLNGPEDRPPAVLAGVRRLVGFLVWWSAQHERVRGVEHRLLSAQHPDGARPVPALGLLRHPELRPGRLFRHRGYPTASSPATDGQQLGPIGSWAVSRPAPRWRPLRLLRLLRACRCGSRPSSRWCSRCCSRPSARPPATSGASARSSWRLQRDDRHPVVPAGRAVFFGYPSITTCCWSCCFLGCRLLVGSHHGKVMLAIREDPLRTELLGYDIRARQLVTFVLAAVLAGSRPALRPVGQLHHADPGRPAAGLAAGDLGGGRRRDSLVAVAVSTYALNWLNYSLSSAGNQYAMVIIGVLLVVVMMFFPRGIIVTLARDLPRYGWRHDGRRLGGALSHGRGSASRPKRWPSVRRRGRDRHGQPRRTGRRAALHHRPQRRRQVDTLSLLRHLPAGPGPNPARRSRRHRPAAVPPRAPGLGLTFQTNRAFTRLAVRRTWRRRHPAGRGTWISGRVTGTATPSTGSASTRSACRPASCRTTSCMARDRHGAGTGPTILLLDEPPPACRPTRPCRPRACCSI